MSYATNDGKATNVALMLSDFKRLDQEAIVLAVRKFDQEGELEHMYTFDS